MMDAHDPLHHVDTAPSPGGFSLPITGSATAAATQAVHFGVGGVNGVPLKMMRGGALLPSAMTATQGVKRSFPFPMGSREGGRVYGGFKFHVIVCEGGGRRQTVHINTTNTCASNRKKGRTY